MTKYIIDTVERDSGEFIESRPADLLVYRGIEYEILGSLVPGKEYDTATANIHDFATHTVFLKKGKEELADLAFLAHNPPVAGENLVGRILRADDPRVEIGKVVPLPIRVLVKEPAAK